MPKPEHRASFEFAERVCQRLGRRLQELREGRKLSMYALWQKCGVTREMISRIERGLSRPTAFVLARLAHGLEIEPRELWPGPDEKRA